MMITKRDGWSYSNIRDTGTSNTCRTIERGKQESRECLHSALLRAWSSREKISGRICEREYISGALGDSTKLNTVPRKVARLQIFLCTRELRIRELLANDREISSIIEFLRWRKRARFSSGWNARLDFKRSIVRE